MCNHAHYTLYNCSYYFGFNYMYYDWLIICKNHENGPLEIFCYTVASCPTPLLPVILLATNFIKIVNVYLQL
jgi:hypothetical protein